MIRNEAGNHNLIIIIIYKDYQTFKIILNKILKIRLRK